MTRWTMDCRRTLLVSFGIVAGAFGCVSSNGLSPTSNSDAAAAHAGILPDLGKKDYSPQTLVAYGKVKEDAAMEPRRTAVEQEQLRDDARKAYQEALRKDPDDLTALTVLAR